MYRPLNGPSMADNQEAEIRVKRLIQQDLDIWRERHQILYQLVLDIVEEVEAIKDRMEALEQRLGR